MQGSAGLPKGRIDKHHKNGVMFITYSLLIASLKKTLTTVDAQNEDMSHRAEDDLPNPKDLGVLPGTRLFQVVEWLAGQDGKGKCLIILDECHKAKNLIAKEGGCCASPSHLSLQHNGTSVQCITCHDAMLNVL